MERQYINKIFEDTKTIINKKMHQFLLQLLSKGFLKSENTLKNKKILKQLEKDKNFINDNIIKKKENYINYKYEKRNLNNIFNLVKMQNSEYAGEILENLLIIVFSFAFKVQKEQKTFGKYLYNNLKNLKNENELAKWFNQDKLIFHYNLKELLDNDVSGSNIKEDDKNEIQKEFIYYFLKLIYNEKYNNNNHKNIKFIKYLNNGVFNNINEFNQDNYHNEKTITSGNKTYTKSDLVSNVLYTSTFDRVKISYPLKLIRSLLISAYIYYQNRNSPLMNYINESNEF